MLQPRAGVVGVAEGVHVGVGGRADEHLRVEVGGTPLVRRIGVNGKTEVLKRVFNQGCYYWDRINLSRYAVPVVDPKVGGDMQAQSGKIVGQYEKFIFFSRESRGGR